MKKENKTLLIDCGNTCLKWSMLDGEKLSVQQSLLHKDTSVLEVYKNVIESQAKNCSSVVLVSVLGEVFLAGAKKITEDADLLFMDVNSQAQLAGVRNAYLKPEMLGADRLVAMIGAYQLALASPTTQASIVIDSGTATTIDALDETGQHLGGVIFPGLQLSLQSLSSSTELLPMLTAAELEFETKGLATETSQAIVSGCLLSLAGGIDGICNKMEQQLQTNSFLPSVAVKRILCGGAAQALLPHLENNYDNHEDLIMLGLQKIKNESFKND